jgi:hypothetical protein
MTPQTYPLFAQLHGDGHDELYRVIGWVEEGEGTEDFAPILVHHRRPGRVTFRPAPDDHYTLTEDPNYNHALAIFQK